MSHTAKGDPSAEPIFILGLPRTGTTLTERILGSHTDVFSAGELNDFPISLVRVTQKSAQRQLDRSELVEWTSKIDFVQLGEVYLESTRRLTGHTQRFIDKLPLNFLYCGLIHLALPNAKIVHVRRHPLDSIYAMYKQLFKDAYPMSYDLEDLKEYYVAYDRLMTHWHEVLPGVIYDLHYESLIANQEGETRNLLEYCDLDWQDSVLEFEKNKAASTTASAAQVRQKIYTSSVEKWKNYEPHLRAVGEYLESQGIPIKGL